MEGRAGRASKKEHKEKTEITPLTRRTWSGEVVKESPNVVSISKAGHLINKYLSPSGMQKGVLFENVWGHTA